MTRPKPTRRALFKGILGCAGLAGLSSVVPGWARRAYAAGETTAFPSIVIHLRGGLDVAMHWDARPNLPNRQIAQVRETSFGLRWNDDLLSPLMPHMEDAVVVHNLRTKAGHESGAADLWWGGKSRLSDGPWANFLASGLNARCKVPAPNVISYSDKDNRPGMQFLASVNSSPDPLAAAQRVRRANDFSAGLDVGASGPDPTLQLPIFDRVADADGRLYSPRRQSRTVESFSQANSQANDLLLQPPPAFWPPDQATMAMFDITESDLEFRGLQNNQNFKVQAALAFQVARLQVSHVATISNQSDSLSPYDASHRRSIEGQTEASAVTVPVIANLLTALKQTPSPVVPGLMMFDTTHVVILSELGRDYRPQGGSGPGTGHWGWTQPLLFGGNFKRGYSFGRANDQLAGVPANFDTGGEGAAQNPEIDNLVVTLMKASGVDASGWSNAAPINALLAGA